MSFQEARRLRHRPRPHLLCAARGRTVCVRVRFPSGTRQVKLDHAPWICKPMVELEEAQVPSREVTRCHHRVVLRQPGFLPRVCRGDWNLCTTFRIVAAGVFGSWMSLAMSL